MTNWSRARAIRWTLVGGLVFFAMGFTFDAMPVWMDTDSVEYLAMANSLAHGDGIRGFDGEPAGLWGPGFPVLLAPAVALERNVFETLPWLHAWIWTLLLVGVVVPLAWQLESWRWRWPLLVGMLIGAPVITVTSSMHADAILLAGAIACTFLAERVRGGARPWGLLFLASLLPLVKLIGLLVWPAVIWALWPRGRVRWIGPVAMTVPLGIWTARNFALFGRFSERFPGEPGSLDSLVRSGSIEITTWLVPRVYSNFVLLISGAIVIVMLVYLWHRLGRPELPGCQTPWVLSAASFLILFLIGSMTQRAGAPDPRLLAPLFALVLVLASRFGAALQTRSGIPVMVIGIAWTALIGVQGVLATQHHLLAPQAIYFDQEDRFAAIVKTSVRDVSRGEKVWSNVPEYVYWQTGLWSQWPESHRIPAEFGASGSPVRLIWFGFSERDGLVHPRDIEGVDWMEPIVRLDVELWRGVVR